MVLCWNCASARATEDHHPIPRCRGGQRTIPLCGACHELAHGQEFSTLVLEGVARARASGRKAAKLPLGFVTNSDGVIVPDPEWDARINQFLETIRLGSTVRAARSILGCCPTSAYKIWARYANK
jgi:hypothetical protein